MTRRLRQALAQEESVLLGVDFALGYPAGFAAAAGLEARVTDPTAVSPAPWRGIWEALRGAIDDRADNGNNRFEIAAELNQRCGVRGPFWGAPPTRAGPYLTTTRPPLPRGVATAGGLPRRRLVEQRVPSAHEVWKLYTTGSVGSQSLLGIAGLARLRETADLRDRLRVWPFELTFGPSGEAAAGDLPGGTPPGPSVVIAEVYPSLVNREAAAVRRQRRG